MFWSAEGNLTLVLILLTVLVFVIYPLTTAGMGSRAGVMVCALLLIAGVPTVARFSKAAGWANRFLAAGWVGVEMVIQFSPSFSLLVVESCLVILALLFLEIILTIQVFGPGAITAHRIRGAIAIYLLLGLSWAWIYRFILLLAPGAIVYNGASDHPLVAGTNLLYFSFTTLTTVGYGDIAPVHAIARSLANLEALTGQLYPAIFIGRLVTLAGSPDRK